MRGLLVLCVLLLAGCAGRISAPIGEPGPAAQIEQRRPAADVGARYYVIKKSDTLYSIALEQGVDYRDLAAWNNIENPARIQIGQTLRVSPPAAPGTAQPALVAGTEIRPVTQQGSVMARPLDGGAVSPAPTLATDSETVKRSPKGGKLPYSEQNLALLKSRQDAAPAATQSVVTPAPVVTEKPASASPPPPAASSSGDGPIDWSWPAPGKLIAGFSDAGSAETNKGIDIAGKTGDPVAAAASGKVVYVGNGLRGYGNLVIVRHNAAFLSAYAHNSRILVKEGQEVARGQKIAELGNSDADQPKLHFEVRHQGKPVDPLKHLPPR